jgi:ubiquinone/menaquinone biosynthesis C-methylase UbiE
MAETDRIRLAYAKRDALGKGKLYSLFNPSSLFMAQQREKEILSLLALFDMHDLSTKKILDVGCGTGAVLRDFVRYGAMPENCFGIDLLPDRIEKALHLSPNMHFTTGNAENLPYDSETFDMALSFTIFTSIFDTDMKRNIAREILRVVKKAGIVLWFDYHMDNPKNPDVKGVGRKEIFQLFSGCDIYLKRTTLAPPITRFLAPRSYLLCYLLEKFSIFNTHYLGVIRKQG